MPRTRIRYPPASPIGNIPLPPASGCGGGAYGDADARARARARALPPHLAKEAEELVWALGSKAAWHKRSLPVQIVKNKGDVEAAAAAAAAVAMPAPPSRVEELKHRMLLLMGMR